MIHPRRPGGKVFTTASDVADHFEVPGTDVGVFLSTSAEAQVFEWSQLQSGVFSHAVRSAILGGADADADGQISYQELEGFVAIASGDVANSLYRPHLYVRPTRADSPFMKVLVGHQRVVELSGFERRVTLRDDKGVRWADLHPETGFVPRLTLPMAQGGSWPPPGVRAEATPSFLRSSRSPLGPLR